MTKVSVDEFLKYEKMEAVDYIIPGDSNVTFQMKFEEYYQTSRYTLEVSGSLTDVGTIVKEQITKGKIAENEYEIVLDKMILEQMKTQSITAYMGIKTEEDLLGKKIYIDNMKEFTIVGFVDQKSPSIYANKSIFVNLLNNAKTSGNSFGIFTQSSEAGREDEVLDYTQYLDDITITKGRMPENDYEVIVNKTNQETTKLNKTIKTQINGKELTVVRILRKQNK